MRRIINQGDIDMFRRYLMENEKSKATVEKYIRDIYKFVNFSELKTIDKNLTLEYKAYLENKYTVRSANSMIAALNAFLKFKEWQDCCIKQFRIQTQIFYPEEKELSREEYWRLVNAAKHSGNERLQMMIQTICSTGIRISELEFITVEAVEHGEAIVNCKGKTRHVFLVNDLRKVLKKYIKRTGIAGGPIFVTKRGRPVNRCNVWREMKSLCKKAHVSASKVFPHNLRHLFARVFYEVDKDIAKLANILGHTSINTTRIYVAATGAEHRRKMEMMRLLI